MADSFYSAPRALTDQRPLAQPGRGKPQASARPMAVRDDDRRLKLALLVIIGLMVLIVAGEIVFQTAIAPRLLLERVNLDSDLSLGQTEILAAAGVALHDRFYDLDPARIERNLGQLAAVQEVKVKTVFPDALSIRLRSRQAVALALVRGSNGGQVPVQIDSLGFVFGWGLPAGQEGMPVISGIEFRNFRLGMQLPQTVVPFLQDLAALRVKAPALYRAFSEFKLQPMGAAQLEITAYTISSPVAVRLNARLTEERALYTLRTMEMLEKTEGLSRVREIDFRTNNVVYTKGVD